ncbi:MAG: S-layer homology domain-containing protein, partial [Acidimicrobiia bacterium]
FTDDDDSVFESDIDKLATAGITKGCNPPDNTMFCPNDHVTRGQMAAFLVRAFGYTDDGGGDLFVDDDDSVFEGDIDRLATAGVTKGCNPPTNDRYCPTDLVLRDQMASFLGRALGLTPITPTTTTPEGVTFEDGTWVVGTEIPAGTYRNSESSDGCYWERLSGFSGEFDAIIANNFSFEINIVTIDPSDAGFGSSNCVSWSDDLSPRTDSPTSPFEGGHYLVGTEVGAGTWRNSDSSDGCYWERLSGFSGEFDDIIANSFSYEIETVTISETDVGFFSERCGAWTKLG